MALVANQTIARDLSTASSAPEALSDPSTRPSTLEPSTSASGNFSIHVPAAGSGPAVMPSPVPPPETPPQSEPSEYLEEKPRSRENQKLLSVSFNQDHSCFSGGTDTGFRIFNCDPFKETFRREFQNGGIGHCEMLFRCNILAIVGGGQNPRHPPNKVMIWDDHQSRCIGELSFRSEVRAVCLRRDRIVVVLEHKVYVYNFADLKLLQQIDTIANPTGLCCLSPEAKSAVLACPGQRSGQVRVELYESKRARFVAAHNAALACMALTLDGQRLATASSKGTLIRIFNTADCTKLQELRRGADTATIYSIAFSPISSWLAVSSDKGTVHVFALKGAAAGEDRGAAEAAAAVGGGGAAQSQVGGVGGGSPPHGSPSGGSPGGNPGSSLAFLKGVLPKYFSSEWSFAQFRLPEEVRFMVAFGVLKNTLIIVGLDGSYHKVCFDPASGGEMIRQEYENFMKAEDSMDMDK